MMSKTRILGLFASVACVLSPSFGDDPPLTLNQTTAALEVHHGDRLLLRYHKTAPPAPEGIDKVYQRSGYIHPLNTLSGRQVTGDFAADHPHQHGLFAAWVKTKFAGRDVDFWNLHRQLGRVEHRRVVATKQNRDAVGFEVEHVYLDETTAPATAAIEESWQVEISRPAVDHWTMDLRITQRAVAGDQPVEVQQHHYGGLAVRGSHAWYRSDASRRHRQWQAVPEDQQAEQVPGWEAIGFGFLTDAGFARHNGNHTPARWVDMFGRTPQGLAGVAVISHPGNLRAPQPVRLHPTKPYFCFAPMVRERFTISDKPLTMRYRVVIHDGVPDPRLLQSQQESFARHANRDPR